MLLVFSSEFCKIIQKSFFAKHLRASARSSHQRWSTKNVFLKISKNSQENTCAKLFLITQQAETCNFIKKETLGQVFSCECCHIFKYAFLTEYLWMTASELLLCISPFQIHAVW